MTLHIYNTLTRTKEEFKPIDPENVRLYACGPTVHNYAHIGNARPAVIFDLLARLLRHIYGKTQVSYTRNITDIDDKIIKASRETGEPISSITEKFTRIYNEDMGSLGVAIPDHQPRATQYIPQMIRMVENLIQSGHAYAAEGHVLFHVPAWKDYGRLSRHGRDELIAGARVEVAPYKKDPADFVLWKPSTPDQPGWNSPWGRGRPGWHLECSAMNEAINGESFDIHAGGEDLIFPHHENEIAQSTCAHGGKVYANYWMHNGFLTMDSEKMSKSLGNVLLVHNLIKEYPPEALRFVLLSAHYRQPLNFTHDAVVQAKNTLDRYYGFLRDSKDAITGGAQVPASFVAALEDDLNTPQAFAELAQAAKKLSTASPAEKAIAKGELLAAGKIFGLLQQDPEAWFKGGETMQAETGQFSLSGQDIDLKIEARNLAKKNKDFKTADQIRAELDQAGIVLEDTAQGTRWKRKG